MKKWTGDIIFILVVGALIGGWIYLYPSPGDSPLAPLETPTDLNLQDLPSYSSPEGLRLAYRLYRPAGDASFVLIFLHDTLLHGGWYANLGQALAEQGVAVYLPDRRGRGRSEGDWHLVAEDKSVLIEDITAMISVARSRYPQSEIFLGGHGRGAGLVLEYLASQRPLSGVLLVSPYITEEEPDRRRGGWTRFVTVHPGEAFLARSGLVDWRVWRYNWPQSMIEEDPLIETKSSISWDQETVPSHLDQAYSASTPVLGIIGQDDPLFDPQGTAELLSRFRQAEHQLELVPDADYLSVVDVAAVPIAAWLAER